MITEQPLLVGLQERRKVGVFEARVTIRGGFKERTGVES